MDNFSVKNIWRIGTRIFFGKDFVDIHDFEKDAYAFFSTHNTPSLPFSADSFCKRINHIYAQKVDRLEQLGIQLEETGDFQNISLDAKPSALGLPYTLSYIHTPTNIKTSFDGVIFISELLIANQELSVRDLKKYAEENGSDFWQGDSAQFGNSNHKSLWDQFSFTASARTSWRYATESTALPSGTFNPKLEDIRIILLIRLIDNRIVRITYPTMDASHGTSFDLLVGHLSHIKQVIAHEAESYRYLMLIEDRLRFIRNDVLKRKDRILTRDTPLAPWAIPGLFSVKEWRKAISGWTEIYRDQEELLRYRNYLTSYAPILDSFRNFEEKGIGFYNLESPFQVVDENAPVPLQKLAQYPTPAPHPLQITETEITLADYKPHFCVFNGYPERISEFRKKLYALVEDTSDMLNRLSTTPGVQVSLIATVISLAALVIALISFVISLIIGIVAGVV